MTDHLPENSQRLKVVNYFDKKATSPMLVWATVFRDDNMISISIVEFRYYVVIIILVNLGKL